MFQIHQQQLLMLLFVMQTQFNQSRERLGQALRE